MGGEMVHDELPQVLRIPCGHPDEIVGGTGQVEDHQHTWQLTDRRGERVDLLARVDGEADGNQGLQRPAEGGEVEFGVKAADHTALTQSAKPVQRGRRRDPDALRETMIGDPGVRCEQFQNRAIDVVQSGVLMIRHWPARVPSA